MDVKALFSQNAIGSFVAAFLLVGGSTSAFAQTKPEALTQPSGDALLNEERIGNPLSKVPHNDDGPSTPPPTPTPTPDKDAVFHGENLQRFESEIGGFNELTR